MNQRDLEDWANRAAADLKEYLAAAREAGRDQPVTAALLDEFEAISNGRPTWVTKLAAMRGDDDGCIPGDW